MCALRDGAHGSKMGGIAGSGTDGCYSIVISGAYQDADTGDTVMYSSTMRRSLADLRENSGAKALLRSKETRKAVRVLRSAGAKWRGAPSVGIRYDGLYQVVSVSEVDLKGDWIMVFQLERMDNQPDIDQNRPTLREARLYE